MHLCWLKYRRFCVGSFFCLGYDAFIMQAVTDVSKDCSAFILGLKQNVKVLRFLRKVKNFSPSHSALDPKRLYVQEYRSENFKSRAILLLSGVLTKFVVSYECWCKLQSLSLAMLPNLLMLVV